MGISWEESKTKTTVSEMAIHRLHGDDHPAKATQMDWTPGLNGMDDEHLPKLFFHSELPVGLIAAQREILKAVQRSAQEQHVGGKNSPSAA